MQNKCSVTPDNITSLQEHEVFVFGSNLAGRHNGGAACAAMNFGAVYGQGEGLQGQCYALPTLDEQYCQLNMSNLKMHIASLLACIKQNHQLHFLITKVGCGIAGYSVDDIAPLFRQFQNLSNCSLPQEFIEQICE